MVLAEMVIVNPNIYAAMSHGLFVAGFPNRIRRVTGGRAPQFPQD